MEKRRLCEWSREDYVNGLDKSCVQTCRWCKKHLKESCFLSRKENINKPLELGLYRGVESRPREVLMVQLTIFQNSEALILKNPVWYQINASLHVWSFFSNKPVIIFSNYSKWWPKPVKSWTFSWSSPFCWVLYLIWNRSFYSSK